MSRRKKEYAIVGVGGRCGMYRRSILETYAHNSTLVGLCDKNRGRLALRVAQAKAAGTDVPGYSDRQLDRLIKETRPDFRP